ncbi:hypothetical protein Ccar_22645 [Clostridium carboxidivorans P7]|uniref:Outer membrane efflux protein n=1 Tax=Clostridium carboxidivorans P7 TaxID=536227 RepID=C6PWJ4_9CLOT|nr:TolC family protein [Clostridium carboxidivorans]AKN33473.1 hypothetical protein Ccar_22645 [Clostridium carboxidivorans P7]EET86405.1 conserved hypothetical protein [Clostridium carboxidivorans P7]EFG89145.1 hypothetical protein CLCAR_1020 [Clostridium carboxidivorans P7]
MRKKLSLLIALAVSLSVTTTSFAAAVDNTAASDTTNVTGINISDLTLEQALNTVEDRSLDLKSMDIKIDAMKKQLSNDKNKATAVDASGKSQSQYQNGTYAQTMITRDVTPIKDQQNLDDQNNARDEKLNSIKFDLEKQYTNAITAKEQIDNINKNITDLDEQIKQTQAKIDLGQVTKDTMNTLLVQKSKLLSSITTPYAQQQQAISNIKKYLNIDSKSNALNLASAKSSFVKFDDTNIEGKINDAVKNDKSLNSIQKNIDIQRKQVDIQTKYAYDSLTEPQNSQLTLQDLENQYWNNNSSLNVSLWKAYYALKNKENTVEAQLINEESAKMSYYKAQESFNNGLINKVDLDSAELAYNNQKVTTEQNINDYMITQKQFKYALDGHASTASSIQ